MAPPPISATPPVQGLKVTDEYERCHVRGTIAYPCEGTKIEAGDIAGIVNSNKTGQDGELLTFGIYSVWMQGVVLSEPCEDTSQYKLSIIEEGRVYQKIVGGSKTIELIDGDTVCIDKSNLILVEKLKQQEKLEVKAEPEQATPNDPILSDSLPARGGSSLTLLDSAIEYTKGINPLLLPPAVIVIGALGLTKVF
ncbi:MAG: hypothetical protein KDK66_06250 [Deltaproteobacteria bacterium]|nr:hypothetical protein [Deltaproteobacteria bacterium]